MPSPPVDVRRVLMIKPSALGDVVHALPIAGLVKRRWPEAHLSWLVSRPFAGLVETHPAVDRVIFFDRARGAPIRWHARAARELVRTLREARFDLVIDLQGLFRSGWLTWRTGAPHRIGFAYAREAAGLFYNHRVPSRGPDRHAIERYLDIAEALGCGRSPVRFDITTTPDDDAAVSKLLAPLAGEPYAVFLPGTNWPTKRWPAERFAELAERAAVEGSGLRIVLAGGQDATEAGRVIEQRLAGRVEALNLIGRTEIRELAVLLRGAALVVTNDSGPMHLAAALDRPLVALFGPTSPERTGPWGRLDSVVRLDIVCSPCFKRRCVHQSCLQLLPAEAVWERCAQQRG